MTHTYDYETIKDVAKRERRRVTDYLVLAQQNDPFYVGAPASLEAARWFADLWRSFEYTRGVHLRRVHYRLVSQYDARKPNGAPYENTDADWTYLENASKYARYLRLVDPEAFVDKRNPEPHIHVGGADWYGEPGYEIDTPAWSLPSIAAELAGELHLTVPCASVYGYDYSQSNQPYHLELWVEKSTMDDVLLPLGRQLGVNVVTSLGFQSITSVLTLIRRVAEAGRPARVFYVSDFDPAGDGMPTAVARQLEYWLQDYAPGCDVALTPIVLTRDQVTRYRLPRIPVKDTDRRKAHFEDRYGEGAVELDALEALYPGTLADIVRAAVAPYRDAHLERQLRRAEERAQEAVDFAWDIAAGPHRAELQTIEHQARGVLETYQDRLAALRDSLDAELAPLQDRLNDLQRAISAAADNLVVDLPGRPEPETDQVDETGWLFSTERDYLGQLAVYRARKHGSDDGSETDRE